MQEFAGGKEREWLELPQGGIGSQQRLLRGAVVGVDPIAHGGLPVVGSVVLCEGGPLSLPPPPQTYRHHPEPF